MAQSRPPAARVPYDARSLLENSGLARPERLVGFGFRRAMKALETGDQAPWEFAWQEFANAAGHDQATQLVARLSVWARCVRRCSGRRIETFPASCPGFCRDECLAISMIAASQHSVCPALRACAFALIGSSEIAPALEAADRFAESLAASGQVLSEQSVCNALTFTAPTSQRLS